MRPWGPRRLPPYSEAGCRHSFPLVTPQILSVEWYDCHSIHICKLTSAYKSSSSAAIRRSPFFQGRAEVTSLVLDLYIY